LNNIKFQGFEVGPITGGGVGWLIKRHIDTLGTGAVIPETIAPSYQMDTVWFYKNYTHQTDGEGYYIGPSAPNGGDGQGPNGFFPVRMNSVWIEYQTVDSTGWDGIQLSGSLDNCRINHNHVHRYGQVNMGSQQAGIIGGSSLNAEIAYDTISSGTGNELQLFMYGTCRVHDNILDSGGSTAGQQVIFRKDIPSTLETHAGQKIYFYNNLVKDPYLETAYLGSNPSGTALADSLYNNAWCIPGANMTTLFSTYIQETPTANYSNNYLSCSLIINNTGNSHIGLRRRKKI
jgi:hypothetical protein